MSAELVGKHCVHRSQDNAHDAHHEIDHTHLSCCQAESAQMQRNVIQDADTYTEQKLK